MFLELLATFVAGFAAAGVVLVLNKILGGRLPRWLMPVAAGAGMIGMTISNEYGWYPRTKASLPEGLEVAMTVNNQEFYRPWTYVKPYVDRFVAVDVATAQTHDNHPGMVIADIYLFGRWAPVSKIKVMFDCPGGRRADLIEGVEFDADGALVNPTWITVSDTDPVAGVACKEV